LEPHHLDATSSSLGDEGAYWFANTFLRYIKNLRQASGFVSFKALAESTLLTATGKYGEGRVAWETKLSDAYERFLYAEEDLRLTSAVARTVTGVTLYEPLCATCGFHPDSHENLCILEDVLLDADMKLVRVKRQGDDEGDYPERWMSRSEVEEFEKSSRHKGRATEIVSTNRCDEIRMKARQVTAAKSLKGYAETGLMTIRCKHSNILSMADLWTGERFLESQALISKVKRDAPGLQRVWGDVFCTNYQLSCNNAFPDLLTNACGEIELCLPTMHRKMHALQCQLLFAGLFSSSASGKPNDELSEQCFQKLSRMAATLKTASPSRRRLLIAQHEQSETERRNQSAHIQVCKTSVTVCT
jgi:hypothetical protein